jgi:hypothetical protein
LLYRLNGEKGVKYMADIKLTAGVDLSVNASSMQNQLKDL